MSWKWTEGTVLPFVEQINLEFRNRRKETLEKLVWGCWALWCERNQRVWQGKSSSMQQIIHRAQSMVDGWSQAQAARRVKVQRELSAASSWCRPAAGKMKLNVDAAVRTNGCGLGWCVRDDRGRFVAGAALPWPGSLSPLSAELVGVREALSWVKDNGWLEIEVESDASRAISEILHGSSCSLVGFLGEDIRDSANYFSSISFCHIKRSANKPAHALASAACSMSDLRSWFYSPPGFVISVL
ncbi:unnamed protein product, partial [Cuscuta europaea]